MKSVFFEPTISLAAKEYPNSRIETPNSMKDIPKIIIPFAPCPFLPSFFGQ
jgi:hypothetical protein